MGVALASTDRQQLRTTTTSARRGIRRVSAASAVDTGSSTPGRGPASTKVDHIKGLRSRSTISATQEDLEYEQIERNHVNAFLSTPHPGPGASFLTSGVELLYQMRGDVPVETESKATNIEDAVQAFHRIGSLYARLAPDDSGVTEGALRQELERQGLPVTPEQVQEVMREAGTQGSGRMMFGDLFSYAVRQEHVLREIFDAMDVYGDGALSVNEVATSFESLGYQVNSEDVGMLIARFDREQQGVITWEAFRDNLMFLPITHAIDVLDYWCDATIMASGTETHTAPPRPQEEDTHTRLWRHFVAGGIAGVVSRTCTAPLDRLKVVLQVQRPDHKLGVISGLKYMLHEGGVKSLWRGNGVNVLKIGPESAIKFYAWEQAKRLLYPHETGPGHDIKPYQRLLAGSLAGLISQSAIFPMEVLKTRLATSKTGQFKGMVACASFIFRNEGILAFYRGMLPAMLGVIPYAGIDLAVYETLRSQYQSEHPGKEPGTILLLGYGAVSSTCGQLASYPLALVRTRLQAHPEIKHGMVAEFRHVISHGGVTALYRGMAANVLKVVPAVSISYVIYEKVKKYLNSPPQPQQ